MFQQKAKKTNEMNNKAKTTATKTSKSTLLFLSIPKSNRNASGIQSSIAHFIRCRSRFRWLSIVCHQHTRVLTAEALCLPATGGGEPLRDSILSSLRGGSGSRRGGSSRSRRRYRTYAKKMKKFQVEKNSTFFF